MLGWKNQEIRELRAELREATERATAAERRRGDAHLDEVRRAHAAQCERLAADVEKWQRKALDLEAGARRVADQNRALREQSETQPSRLELLKLDGEYEDLYGRLCRALRGCARYRRDTAMLSRLVRTQQRQLDDATGMDDPGIAMGADWQARRPDTPPEAKFRAASPSGRLPRREPGLSGVDS